MSMMADTHINQHSDEPLRTEVRVAFAESIRVIWIVLIPFVSAALLHRRKYFTDSTCFQGIIGLGATVWMKHYQLDTVTDEVCLLARKDCAVY